MHKFISFILVGLVALCVALPVQAADAMQNVILQGFLNVADEGATIGDAYIPKEVYEKYVRQFCPDKVPCRIEGYGAFEEDEHDMLFKVKNVATAQQMPLEKHEVSVTNLYLSESSEPSYIEGIVQGENKPITIVGVPSFYEKCYDWDTAKGQQQCPIKKNGIYTVKYVSIRLLLKGKQQPEYDYFGLVDIAPK